MLCFPPITGSVMPAFVLQLVKHCTAAAASPAPTAQTKLESDLLFLLLPSQRVGAGGPLRHGGRRANEQQTSHGEYFLKSSCVFTKNNSTLGGLESEVLFTLQVSQKINILKRLVLVSAFFLPLIPTPSGSAITVSPILRSALPSASAAMGRQSQLYHSIPSAGWSDDDDRALLLFAYRVGLSNLNQARVRARAPPGVGVPL